MGLIRYAPGWTRQPQGAVAINPRWARGLRWAASGFGLRDQISGREADEGLTNQQRNYESRSSGIAWTTALSGSTAYSARPPAWVNGVNIDVTTSDFSVLVVASVVYGADTGPVFCNHGGSNQWRFQANYLANGTSSGGASNGALSMLTYDGSWSTVGAAGVIDGAPHAHLFIRRGTVHELWVDGRLRASQTVAVRNVSGGKTTGLACFWSPSNTPNGDSWYQAAQDFFLGAFWAGAVDPAISAQPWDLFAPRQIWAPMSAGAGPSMPTLSLPTVTAIGATQATPRVTLTY